MSTARHTSSPHLGQAGPDRPTLRHRYVLVSWMSPHGCGNTIVMIQTEKHRAPRLFCGCAPGCEGILLVLGSLGGWGECVLCVQELGWRSRC